MTKHNIFSTPLWHIDGTPQPLIDELLKGVYHIKDNYETVSISNEGGYQSPMFNWEDFHPEGKQYIDSILKEELATSKRYKDGVDKDGRHSKFLPNIFWWININNQGCWNTPHTHPHCDYALVWYLTDVGDRSQISLRDESLLTLMNPFPQRYGDDNQNISIVARKGDIVIFPADIYHYVMPNPKDEDRISISMNLRLC